MQRKGEFMRIIYRKKTRKNFCSKQLMFNLLSLIIKAILRWNVFSILSGPLDRESLQRQLLLIYSSDDSLPALKKRSTWPPSLRRVLFELMAASPCQNKDADEAPRWNSTCFSPPDIIFTLCWRLRSYESSVRSAALHTSFAASDPYVEVFASGCTLSVCLLPAKTDSGAR